MTAQQATAKAYNTEEETMTGFDMGDVPDLNGVAEQESSPLEDGWYAGTILETHSFTDRNGNERVFASEDVPSAAGDSRNIRLQVRVSRSDGKTVNLSALVNYRPEDLSADTVAQIMAHKEKVAEGDQWGPLFRPFATLQRLSKLQAIAGVRAFQRNGNGGLDLKDIYGKTGYFRLVPDPKNPQYKNIKDFRATRPSKVL